MPQENEIIKTMTNLADSGQDEFVNDWAQMARTLLYEQGISNAFLGSTNAQYLIAKVVTDLIEDGNLSSTSLSLIATLRTNHPHSEDATETNDAPAITNAAENTNTEGGENV